MRAITTLLITLIMNTAVMAQSQVPNEQLSEIKSETILLKAKADEAAALQSVTSSLASAPSAMPASAPTAIIENAPIPMGVFGTTHLYALVQMNDGHVIPVPSGETTPGGKWRVTIDGSHVLITAAGGRKH